MSKEEMTEEERKAFEAEPANARVAEIGITVLFLGVPRALDLKVYHQESDKSFVDAMKSINDSLKDKDLGMMASEATLRGLWRFFGKRFAAAIKSCNKLEVSWRPEFIGGALDQFKEAPVKAVN